MNHSTALAMPSPGFNFKHYLAMVERFPKLDEDQERALAERLKRDNDLEAAQKLILSHLRYVVYMARRYAGYGLPQEDLIQEGNIGLMKAVRRYDPGRGVRLMAYAGYWIRAHIHDFILKNWRIVKVVTTKARRKLFYKLRGEKKRLDWLTRSEAEQIADTLDVNPGEVTQMEASLYLADRSFDAPPNVDDDANRAPADYLQDDRCDPDAIVEQREFLDKASFRLREALSILDARSRAIIQSRWLARDHEPQTLQELGERFNVSAERIRQIEAAAIKRLREHLLPRLIEANAADSSTVPGITL